MRWVRVQGHSPGLRTDVAKCAVCSLFGGTDEPAAIVAQWSNGSRFVDVLDADGYAVGLCEACWPTLRNVVNP